jgi:hypothetical protein
MDDAPFASRKAFAPALFLICQCSFSSLKRRAERHDRRQEPADVLVELRSLVCSRELLIGFVERESRPESEKAAAAANYGREIAAVNAATEALVGRHDRRADRTKS